MVGAETAEFLAERGRNVILVEMLADVAIDMEPRTRSYLLYRLKKYPVDIVVNEKVVEINPDGITTESGPWKKRIAGADHVILAVGSKPDQKVSDLLSRSGTKAHLVGDCAKVRDALDAIYEGASLALKI